MSTRSEHSAGSRSWSSNVLVRTTAVLLMATAVPIVSLVWASGVARAEVEQRALDGLVSTAKATVLQEQRAWDDAVRVITAAASRPVPLSALQSRDTDLISQGLHNVLITGPFADVRLYDGTGTLIATASVPGVTPTPFAGLGGPTPSFGDPVDVGPGTARQVAVAIGPGGAGRLVVDVDVTQLLGQPSDLGFGLTGMKFLVTREGTIVAGSTAIGTTLQSELNRSIAAAGRPRTAVIQSPYFDRLTAESYEPLPGQSGMGILVQQARSEVMGGADALASLLRWAALLVGLVGVTLAVALGIFLRRRGRRLATSQEDQARLASIVEASRDAILAKTLDGVVTSWNRGAEVLFGYTAAEMIGNPIENLIPPEGRDVEGQVRTRVAAGLGIEHHETVRVRKDGTAVDVSATLSPIEDAHGRIVGIATICRDVTDRKRAEAKFQGLLESAPDAIVVVGADGLIRLVNRQTEVLFGWSRSELLGQPVEQLMPTRFAAHHPGQRTGYFANPSVRAMGANLELAARRKDGSEFPVDISLSPLETEEGVLVSAAVRDVTERKRAEAALREREEQLAAARDEALEASRLKSQFLANMSHEIRTPMNGVLGMAQLLLTGNLEPEQRRRLLLLHESGQSLLTLINDILDVSKMEAGKLELEEATFNLVATVNSVVSLCSSSADDKGLTLTVEVARGIPELVRGDAFRLRQVLLNIVGNAVKFTEQGGVDLGVTRADGGNLRFTVRDTGIGLDPSAKDYLLEPFSQADASTTRRFGGTGLGLAICQQLVDLMGGSLDFSSEPGVGTTFWFELNLPAAESANGTTPGARRDSSPAFESAVSGVRILLVDDVEINREVGKGLVESLGYQVDTVASGAEAVAAVQAGGYGAVLMDCLMPVLDGYQSTALIRGLEAPMRHVPIIAVTAAAMSDDRARCLDAGMDDYVSKPLDLGRLASVLARCRPGSGTKSATISTPVPVPVPVPADDGSVPEVLGAGSDADGGREAALEDRLELIKRSLPPAAFDRICQLFLSATPELIARLGAANRDGDTETIRSVAHNLKGTMATVGAVRLSALADTLQEGPPTADAGGVLRQIDEEYAKARTVVLSLMAPSASG